MTKKSDAPAIRFKGFSDAWEQRKFSDITFPAGEKNRDNLPLESYSITNEHGFVPQDEKFENGGTMREADKRMYYIVSPNSFAYNPARINVGSIGYQNIGKNVIVSSLYEVFKTSEDVDDRLLWHWFKSPDFQKLIMQLQEGGVRLYFYYDKLCMGEVSLPSLEEQRKIGKLFDTLDNLITLHQRKFEKLTNVKKSMLEKMFPQNGSSYPEIRFKGFTDPWEQRKLGEMVSLRGRIGFRGYTQNDLVGEGDGAITFSPADIDNDGNVSLEGNKYLTWEKYEESPEIKVQIGDILFTKTASIGKVGYVRELKEKATINPQFALLTPNEKANGYFTFLSVRNNVFMKQVRSITGGSSVPTMSQEKLKELTFMTPSLEEQKKIGEYFEKLDYLITLHQRELEKLQNIKKSMLEKMFV